MRAFEPISRLRLCRRCTTFSTSSWCGGRSSDRASCIAVCRGSPCGLLPGVLFQPLDELWTKRQIIANRDNFGVLERCRIFKPCGVLRNAIEIMYVRLRQNLRDKSSVVSVSHCHFFHPAPPRNSAVLVRVKV